MTETFGCPSTPRYVPDMTPGYMDKKILEICSQAFQHDNYYPRA